MTTTNPSVPALITLGGLYSIQWEAEAIEIRFSRLHEGRDMTTSCELTVYMNGGPVLRRRINLLSSTALKSLATELDKRIALDWVIMLEQATWKVLDAYRLGEEPVDLADVDDPGPQMHQVEPLLPANVPTVLSGDGESAKSLLALVMAALMSTGGHLAGLNAEPCRVGYLDWEASRGDHRRRLSMIEAGMGLRPHSVHIPYRRCVQPLSAIVDEVMAWVLDQHIDYLVIDSIGAAVGGDPSDPGLVLEYFRALRAIGLGSLSIHHNNKEGGSYGSVYIRNYSRQLFKAEAKHDDMANAIGLVLTHDKGNDSPRIKPLGFRLDFSTPGMVVMSDQDVASIPGLEKSAPISDRIHHVMEGSPKPWMHHDIADQLDANPESVRKSLQRGEGRLFTKLPTGWINAN